MIQRYPNAFVPDFFSELAALGASGLFAAGGPQVANRAYYVPAVFNLPSQLTTISFVAANGTGNYDLGFYDGYTKGKIASTGSTAMSAAGVKTLTFSPDYRVRPGKLYYAAVAFSSTSASLWRAAAPDTTSHIQAGEAQEASALPLPSTMTPATLASAHAPVFIFGIR